MRIESVEITDFRNIREARLSFAPGLNLVVGDNGQGKTNLVEAITFLSWLRSFRTSRSQDLPRTGCPAARLAGRVVGPRGSGDLEVHIEPGRRRAWRDGRGIRSRREVREVLSVVFLSPDDPAVLEGAGEGRRLLLDRLAWLLDPSYEGLLDRHVRLLKERNRRLKDEQTPSDPRWWEAMDEAMARSGAEVTARRKGVVWEMERRLPGILRDLFGEDLGLRLVYHCRWSPGQEAPSGEGLLAALRQSLSVDRSVGHTTVGPHADDLEVETQGMRTRGHASRGQRKVLMLAWKVVEAILHRERFGEEAVMVLDDALADLDPGRQQRVLEVLGRREGQTFLTGATVPLDRDLAARVFRARQGEFRQERKEQA